MHASGVEAYKFVRLDICGIGNSLHILWFCVYRIDILSLKLIISMVYRHLESYFRSLYFGFETSRHQVHTKASWMRDVTPPLHIHILKVVAQLVKCSSHICRETWSRSSNPPPLWKNTISNKTLFLILYRRQVVPLRKLPAHSPVYTK